MGGIAQKQNEQAVLPFQPFVFVEVECGDAPPIANGSIEYTGEKFDKVTHYLCDEGFYSQGGELSRKCTGAGTYDGTPVTCQREYLVSFGGHLVIYIP